MFFHKWFIVLTSACVEAKSLNCNICRQPNGGDIGSMTILNACQENVYFVRQAPVPTPAPFRALRPGQSLIEEYEWFPEGGVSLKFANFEGKQPPKGFSWSANITQFEYTFCPTCLNVDISNVNAFPQPPFLHGGIQWTSNDPDQGTCGTKTCQPGVYNCTDAYNFPTDDKKEFSCHPETDIEVVLCPRFATMDEHMSGVGLNSTCRS